MITSLFINEMAISHSKSNRSFLNPEWVADCINNSLKRNRKPDFFDTFMLSGVINNSDDRDVLSNINKVFRNECNKFDRNYNAEDEDLQRIKDIFNKYISRYNDVLSKIKSKVFSDGYLDEVFEIIELKHNPVIDVSETFTITEQDISTFLSIPGTEVKEVSLFRSVSELFLYSLSNYTSMDGVEDGDPYLDLVNGYRAVPFSNYRKYLCIVRDNLSDRHN